MSQLFVKWGEDYCPELNVPEGEDRDKVMEKALGTLSDYEMTGLSPNEVGILNSHRQIIADFLNAKPRVLSKEEAAMMPVGTVVWLEERANHSAPCSPVVRTRRWYGNAEWGACDNDPRLEYGLLMRYWTTNPSRAQRDKTPWG